MFIRLFLLFTIIPLVELSLLIKIGSIFGVWHTIFVVIFTGILGAYLARNQGLRVMAELNDSLTRGQTPTDSIIDGLLVLLSAALLVTPGVLTDAVGFILVIPQTRKPIRNQIKVYVTAKMKEGAYSPGGSGFYYSYQSYKPDDKERLKKDDDDDIIDV